MEPTKFERMTSANLLALDTLIQVAYHHWGAPKNEVREHLCKCRDAMAPRMRKEGASDEEIALVEDTLTTAISSLR